MIVTKREERMKILDKELNGSQSVAVSRQPSGKVGAEFRYLWLTADG
jgi:hypothetical protein